MKTLQHTVIQKALLIFLLLCLNKLGIFVTGGEEQYLALAKQWIAPDWIPNSFTFGEPPGTRLLFQLITGPVMVAMDFVTAMFLLRMANFALIAIPIALIFERMKFNLIETFTLAQFLIMGPQCFFGGEWIFNNVEPKSFAYVFVFFGLHEIMRERLRTAAVLFAIATCFHLLVGGWLFISVSIGLLLHYSWRRLIPYAVIYTGCVLPIVIYVMSGYFGDAAVETDVNLNWVYCYHRLPNHLGIFRDFSYFLSKHAIGVFIAMLATGFVLWHRRSLSGTHARLNTIVLVILAINLCFVLVALADHVFLNNSGGLLLKSYPFRSNSIGYFLFILLLYIFLKKKLSNKKWMPQFAKTMIALFIGLTVLFTFFNVRRSFDSFRDPAFDTMAVYIKEHTDRTARITILDSDQIGMVYNSFTRKAERENFFVHKFVPYQKDKLLEWYQREQALQKLNDDVEFFSTFLKRYRTDYLLTKVARSHEKLNKVWSVEDYILYAVTE